jgi:predicted small lipoprotein YifL
MRRHITILILATLFALGGCGKREQEPPTDANATGDQTLADRASRAIQDTTDFVAQQKDKLVESAQGQLDKLEAQFNNWREEAGIEDEQARQKLNALSEEFRTALAQARGALDKAREAGAETWKETKPALESAVKEAEAAFDAVVAYIKARAAERQQKQTPDPVIE